MLPDVELTLPQPYEELDHTADMGVRVRGASAEETLARLICVLGRLLTGADDLAPVDRIHLAVGGGDLPLAAVDALRELLYRFAVDRVAPVSCRASHLDGDRFELEVGVAPYHAGDGTTGTDIKAVTYHEAMFEPDGDDWVAQVVFDV